MITRRTWIASVAALAGCETVSAPNVSPGGSLKAAIDALPPEGGVIRLAPGVYREKLVVEKPNVTLIGLGRKPDDVVLVWGDGAKYAGGTGQSYSVRITGDGFAARNLTIENDYSKQHPDDRTQAVACYVTADRVVFANVRFLGAQDTLYAASPGCRGDGCTRPAARQYFADCYIEGEVDFIFGDAKAFFDRCHIHGIAYPSVMFTAQSKLTPEQDSAYVFSRCRLTADPAAEEVWLGRPWRDYSTVVYLDCEMDAPIRPAGWREWTPGQTTRLSTATYGEFGSRGSGANPAARDPHSRQLTSAEADSWRLPRFFPDWRPPA